METLIAWLGFLGSWLLFAGPIYQAAIELQEQDIEVDRIRSVGDSVPKPAEISAWWWLLPPVKFWLEHRRSERIRRLYFEALESADVEALLSFMNKALGWLLVGLGGLCIALKETYELVEHQQWNNLTFWLLALCLGLASILHTIVRVKRTIALVRDSKTSR